MMKKDLAAARKKWIEEAKTPKEKTERERSDFLKYQDSAGKFADFHSNRHTFITNLERSTSPRTAQTLARHCDIRLTMGVYTHIGLHDQTTAIELLPAPPELRPSARAPQGNMQVCDNGTEPKEPNGHTTGKVPLDALWAQLPEQVKTRLLATLKAGPSSDLMASQSVMKTERHVLAATPATVVGGSFLALFSALYFFIASQGLPTIGWHFVPILSPSLIRIF